VGSVARGLPALLVDFLVVGGLLEVPPCSEVKRARGVHREEFRGQLPMERLRRGTLNEWHHGPPLGRVLEAHVGRNLRVPGHRPPLGKDGTDLLRQRRRELPVAIYLDAQFER